MYASGPDPEVERNIFFGLNFIDISMCNLPVHLAIVCTDYVILEKLKNFENKFWSSCLKRNFVNK